MSLALAARYSRALADLAFDPKHEVTPDALAEDLDRLLAELEAYRPLREVLTSPAVPLGKKRAVVEKLCAQQGFHALTRKFLCVVLDHRRVPLLRAIRDGFRRVVDERLGVAPATVVSAVELTLEERQMFAQRVEELTGKRPRCEFQVDPAILGGAVLRLGSLVYDGSVRGRLQSLEAHLTRNV